MTGTLQQKPYWDREHQAAYLAQARARQAEAQARREGAELARDLDSIWTELPVTDREILRSCLTRGSDEIIATRMTSH